MAFRSFGVRSRHCSSLIFMVILWLFLFTNTSKVKGADTQEKIVYQIIEEAGNKGKAKGFDYVDINTYSMKFLANGYFYSLIPPVRLL